MPNPNLEQRKLAAIMFTDMLGDSALARRHGSANSEVANALAFK